MLERTSFIIVLAANGYEAMDRLRERPVDLVVTDMVMPEMDGIELVRTLAVDQPGLPIIAISGLHDWANYLSMAMKFGAKAGVQKSVAPPNSWRPYGGFYQRVDEDRYPSCRSRNA